MKHKILLSVFSVAISILILARGRWLSHRREGTGNEFRDSVRMAKLLIENQYEPKLNRVKPAGAIFRAQGYEME